MEFDDFGFLYEFDETSGAVNRMVEFIKGASDIGLSLSRGAKASY